MQKWFSELTNFKSNPYHPFVWIVGNPDIGNNVYIGGFSEINAKDAKIKIGDNCDIASFVSLNCADSHLKCISLSKDIVRKDIVLEQNVIVGSHSVIKGGAYIGHNSVIAAGSIVGPKVIPPYSVVFGNTSKIKPGYYLNKNDKS